MNWYKTSQIDPFELIKSLRPRIAELANKVINEEFDWECGGGACDQVADSSIAHVLSEAGFDIELGGQEGDDHAWVVARWIMPDGSKRYFEVDIPANVYETGAGYDWERIEGAVIRPEDVFIGETDSMAWADEDIL